jgi:hypothetical protein
VSLKDRNKKLQKKLGEIKEGEVTRKDHAGTAFPTKGPTSTEGKYEIIMKPEKEKNDS